MAFKRLDGSPAREIFPRYRGYTPWLLANDVAEGSPLAWYCSLCNRLMVAVMKFVLFWFRNGFLLNPNIRFSHIILLHQWQETFLLFLTHVCMSHPIKTKMESLDRFVPRKPLNWKWTWTLRIKMGFRLASQFLLSLTIFPYTDSVTL